MSTSCKDMNKLIKTAMEQLTPDMVHVCLLPSATFVKITHIVNVVRSQTLVRDDERARCPPGSKDLHPDDHSSCEAPEPDDRAAPHGPAPPKKRAPRHRPRT